MKIKDHFQIAELHDGVVTPGHYYCYKNDPVGHGNHVHNAFLPWGEPDESFATPPNIPGNGSGRVVAFRQAFEEQFGRAYRCGGVYVYKHRDWDPERPWSQHAMLEGNAVDYMADGEKQDPIIEWLESDWGEEDLTKDESAQLAQISEYFFELEKAGIVPKEAARSVAFTWGMQKKAKGDDRPGDNEPSAREQQAGWDFAETLSRRNR